VALSFFPLILHMPHISTLLGVLMLVKQMRKECDVSHGKFTHIRADLAADFPFHYSGVAKIHPTRLPEFV